MFTSRIRSRRLPAASPQLGTPVSFAIPSRGINARDALAIMRPDFGISLINVLCEQFGLKVRKGYSEWVASLGGSEVSGAVNSILVYYPASGSVKVFAARATNLYDVTNGGVVDVPLISTLTSSYMTSIMFHNATGAFLLATTDTGGYYIYDGTNWNAPVAGSAPGEITGVDPVNLCFIMEWKKRIWFVQEDSTKAWYLATGAITGTATAFDFGEHFSKGGKLVALANWTVDGGEGIDDYLVAVSSQGDVVIYKGTDPNSAATFSQQGRWAIGALPAGRRQVYAGGGDVYILSQHGLVPVSRLLAAGKNVEVRSSLTISVNIDPLIANLMQTFSGQVGWQIKQLAKEELIIIGVPDGRFFGLKMTTEAWSVISQVPYVSFGDYDAVIYAGTRDGRVVKAFDSPFDNFKIGVHPGEPIRCEVVPAYQTIGRPGLSKAVYMVRTTFLAAVEPVLRFNMLFDYGIPGNVIVPSLPTKISDSWGSGIWNQAIWSGSQKPISRWHGAAGEGVAATIQLAFSCPGDTTLTSIDFWVSREGGPL